MEPERQTVPGGLFVTLEGPEGAGKSTQAALLETALRKRGYDVLRTREPGGTPLGEKLRRLIKDPALPQGICDRSELLLFAASRAQLMQAVVLPQLAAGGVVVCDRFADSTTVYQGCARGLPLSFIRRVHAFSIENRWPDLTIVLDLDIEAGFRRKHLAGGEAARLDRIETETRDFHRRVREGFLQLAREEPDRIRVVSAEAPPDAIHQQILELFACATR